MARAVTTGNRAGRCHCLELLIVVLYFHGASCCSMGCRALKGDIMSKSGNTGRLVLLPITEPLRIAARTRTTDAIPELVCNPTSGAHLCPRVIAKTSTPHREPSPDRLPVTAVAERVGLDLFMTVARYNLRYPGILTCEISRAVLDLRKALPGHNLAELSTRLTIAVDELIKKPLIAENPDVRPSLEAAQRFLRYGIPGGGQG